MPIPVLSFGSIKTAKDVAIGNIFILPMEAETVVAMMVGASLVNEQPRIAILSEPTKLKRFELLNSAHYLSNTVELIEDAAFILSPQPNHILAWRNQEQPGIIIRGANDSISLGEGHLKKFIDLSTGLYVQRPESDAPALAFTSWSLVRRVEENGKTVTIPHL